MQTVEVLRRQESLGFGTHLLNQFLAHEWRRHAELKFAAVIVHAHAFQLGSVRYAIPTKIVTPMAGAQLVVCSRNRVAKGLKPISQEEGEIGEHCLARFR